MLHIIPLKTIVGIIKSITLKLFGTMSPTTPTIIIDIKREIKAVIPVDIIVYDDISMDFNSLTLIQSPKTRFWNLQLIHQ